MPAADVLDAWLPAFLAGERADASLYADEVTVWHNVGEREHTLDAPPSFGRARAVIDDLRHEDVVTLVHADGFVVRATTTGTTPDGVAIRVPACLLVTVVDGRITRFDEYADSIAAAPLVQLLQTTT